MRRKKDLSRTKDFRTRDKGNLEHLNQEERDKPLNKEITFDCMNVDIR